jgi:DNA-binding beta-propeller fold protein YncE
VSRPFLSAFVRDLPWAATGILLAMAFSASAQTLTNTLPGRAVVRMIADPYRDVIYALNSGTATVPGSIVTLDPATGGVLGEVATGRLATDLALAPEGNALYVINAGNRTVARYSTQPVALGETRTVTTPGTYDPSLPLRMAVIPGGQVYFTDGAWTPRLFLLDFASGSQSLAFDDNGGVGAVGVSRSGTSMYLWRQVGWSAGVGSSSVARLGLMDGGWKVVETSSIPMSRDPLDTPVLLDVAGARLFVKQVAFDAAKLGRVIREFPEWIYAVSQDGAVASGVSRLFDVDTGKTMAQWPGSSSVQAFSGSQRHLLRWVPAVGLLVHDLASVVSLAGPEPTPWVPNGTLLGASPARLAWATALPARSFDVFLSTNAVEVAEASTNSPAYLGRTTDLAWPLVVPVPPGTRWHWRVDLNGYDGAVRRGKAWSFATSALEIRPDQVQATGFVGHDALPRDIQVGGAGLPWTARATGGSWLKVEPASGTTAGTVRLGLRTAGLAPGVYNDAVEITGADGTVVVPVRMEVLPLRLNRMLADPLEPRLYATQAGQGAGQPGHFLAFDTTDGRLVASLPIGPNPTDLALHPDNRRIYIANWGQPVTEVIDARTLEAEAPMALGTDVFRVNPAGPARLAIEGFDQWIQVSIVNTATGAIVSRLPWPQREGDSESSPDGRYLYRSDNNISNAALRKYWLGGTSPTLVREGKSLPFGSRLLVMSADGSRLFWQQGVFDSDLGYLGALPERTLASSRDGSVAFGEQRAYDVGEFASMGALPVPATVMAVDGSDTRLWYLHPTNGTLGSVTLASLKAPKISKEPAETNSVTLGGNAQLAAEVQGLAPFQFQWFRDGTPLAGETNRFLNLSAATAAVSGSYVLNVSNPFGVVSTKPASVTIQLPPVFVSQPAATNIPAGNDLVLAAEVAGTPPLTFTWTVNGFPVGSSNGPVLRVPIIQVQQQGLYELRVTNAVGSVLSVPIPVRVLPAAPTWITPPTSLTARENATVTLRGSVRGSFPVRMQWFLEGQPIPGANLLSLTLTNVTAAQQGAYLLSISNGQGSILSDPALLVVERTAPVIARFPSNLMVRAGSNAVLVAEVEGALPLSIQWFRGASPLPGANRGRLELTNVQAGMEGDYWLVASNALGSATSTFARVTLIEPPRLAAPLNSRMGVRGQSLRIPVAVAGTPPIRAAWSRGGVTAESAAPGPDLVLTNLQPAAAGAYQLTLSNAIGSLTETVVVVVHDGVGRAVAWGDSVAGQGEVPPGMGESGVMSLAAGDFHSMALLSDGRILAWGSALHGATQPPFPDGWIAIAAGGRHSLALHASGIVHGFGANDRGQSVPQGGPIRAVKIAAGEAFSAAITTQGTVMAWGDNTFQQTQVPAALTQARPLLGDPLSIIDLATGRSHVLALRRNGTVVAWGSNLAGESTVPATLPPVTAVAAGHRHSVVLTRAGTVLAWGDNRLGQTNVPPGLSNVVAIASGSYHACALLDNGMVVAWGDASLGQLQIPPSLQPVAAIASGYFHGLAIERGQPTLRWSMIPDGLRVAWDGPGILEKAPGLEGPWSPAPDAFNEAIFRPDLDPAPGGFFRLR